MEKVHPQEDSPVLERFRYDIDEIDAEIVRLVRAREVVSENAQRFKKQLGLPARDLEREELIRDKYVAAFGDTTSARALAMAVLEVCRR